MKDRIKNPEVDPVNRTDDQFIETRGRLAIVRDTSDLLVDLMARNLDFDCFIVGTDTPGDPRILAIGSLGPRGLKVSQYDDQVHAWIAGERVHILNADLRAWMLRAAFHSLLGRSPLPGEVSAVCETLVVACAVIPELALLEHCGASYLARLAADHEGIRSVQPNIAKVTRRAEVIIKQQSGSRPEEHMSSLNANRIQWDYDYEVDHCSGDMATRRLLGAVAREIRRVRGDMALSFTEYELALQAIISA